MYSLSWNSLLFVLLEQRELACFHLQLLAGVEQKVNTGPLDCGDKIIPDPSKMGSEDMPMIGLDAMQRANSTLEDFVSICFPY